MTQGDIRQFMSSSESDLKSLMENDSLTKITVYTDGACPNQQNKKRTHKIGGWGVYIPAYKDVVAQSYYGYSMNTTSNQMEMQAIVEALKVCPKKSYLVVYSDSKYFIDGITKWIKGWKRNNWKLSNGQPVKNKHLWIHIDQLSVQFYSITWNWIKGHAGHEGNEQADLLANKGVNKARIKMKTNQEQPHQLARS